MHLFQPLWRQSITRCCCLLSLLSGHSLALEPVPAPSLASCSFHGLQEFPPIHLMCYMWSDSYRQSFHLRVTWEKGLLQHAEAPSSMSSFLNHCEPIIFVGAQFCTPVVSPRFLFTGGRKESHLIILLRKAHNHVSLSKDTACCFPLCHINT